MYDVMLSNNKLEQTSWIQHYLLINLCLKINATGNPGCTLFNSECTISAGYTLRIGPARDRQWQWHQLGHMQVCTSLQTDNHASTPPLSFYRPDALSAAQPTVPKHWRPFVAYSTWEICIHRKTQYERYTVLQVIKGWHSAITYITPRKFF